MCSCYVVYAIFIGLIYLWVPNLFGAFVAICGSIIYCAYRGKYLKKMKLQDLKNEPQVHYEGFETESPHKLEPETQNNHKIDM